MSVDIIFPCLSLVDANRVKLTDAQAMAAQDISPARKSP